jgi:U3 small nucleolar RNA-associated protein 3
VTCTNTLSF